MNLRMCIMAGSGGTAACAMTCLRRGSSSVWRPGMQAASGHMTMMQVSSLLCLVAVAWDVALVT